VTGGSELSADARSKRRGDVEGAAKEAGAGDCLTETETEKGGSACRSPNARTEGDEE